MALFKCYYWQTKGRKSPVRDFIDSLDTASQVRFFSKIKLLETYGSKLRRPHADYVADHIYELRFVGREGHIRVLYFFFDGNKIIVTNGFIKKTWRVPPSELALARDRRKMYYDRQKRS